MDPARPISQPSSGSFASGAFAAGTAELNSAVSVAVSGIQENLDRARSIVRDAVAGLMASFSTLRSVLEHQRALLQDVGKSVGQLGHSNFTAAVGRMVNEFVDEVVRVSHESMRIIEQLLTTSEHVGAIVARAERIDTLARETRFIALNARIETQRAGEAGKTFKVVADEVKRLAGASAELSTQIQRDVDQCFQALQITQRTAESLAAHDMSTVIESRTVLVATIEQLDQINHAVDITLSQVREAIADSIRALQFEDMVQQLLTESARRVRRLGQLMLDAVAAGDPRRADGAARIREISGELRDLGKPMSVTQDNLEQGSVELF
ncbi:MAG: methyl-accepting chemotaxis protein [Polyangiaceae bacterium]